MKRSLFIVLLLCTFTSMAQQKAMYSQYMFNGLALNPAYSATDGSLTVTALTRHQWVGFVGAPNTQTISVHSSIKESNTSFGGILIRDQIGEVLSERGAYFTMAQRVEVGNGAYLAAGINGGIGFENANYSEKYNESIDSSTDPVFQNAANRSATLGFGMVYFSENYYLGFSSPHFYSHNISSKTAETVINHKPHYILQGGFITPISDGIKFKPNFLVKYVNGAPVQFDVNANFLIKETVWLGASYRSLDSFDALAQVYVSPRIAIGYAYDFTTTLLRDVQKGSHEIMLQFRLPVKGRNYPRCYF